MRNDFAPGLSSTRLPFVDLAPLVDSVLRQLHGQVSPERVHSELQHLLAGEFAQARVTAYLPIFLTRYACEALRREGGGAAGAQR